ncbi:hypothetical protein PSHT_10421 [Puccinia striiformis]|uniref:HAT C-terminal dimerisation domain-containing protein n=1 Tax=Puccinia striiformis TaxID=27350 RepID=A0A2S4V9X7_9BASI|nr:hypothetical protein PSHT_10421 [Puccinia striiformis]
MYECKWCRHVYKKSEGTSCNLKKHRDGNHTRRPCPNRSDAVAAGCKLPITSQELDKLDVTHHQGTMTEYLKTKAFDLKVFNQLLVMWLVRFSLPWSRIDDFLLWIAFNYVRRGVDLYSRTWAATEAHRLYLNLQAKVVTTLQDLGSKFTLIHDVWTTKGNRHAFLGISVSYITEDWKFVICHLGMKLTHHFYFPSTYILAQTTDSGSNNFTMATEIDRLILKKTGVDLNLAENHIPREELLESRKSTLGFVPGLSSVAEESHDVEPTDTYVPEDVDLGNNPLEADDFNNNDPADPLIEDQSPQNKNSIGGILKKVDFIIQRITSSAAKRFEYTTWSKNLKINGLSLIAGYGIRWNIKFQSRERAYKGQMVIAKLLELENHRQKREGGPNYFSNLDITLSEWEVVNQLNETLSAWFPSYYTYTEELLRSLFNSKKAEIEATKEPAPAPEKQKKDKSRRTVNHEFDFFPETVEAPVADELSVYLGGIYKLHSDHVKESLEWWKEHCQEFPILALLARDYLACCATSASVERCFSAAADTCSSDRGSLAARTIERCVSSHQWLAQGIKPDGDFQTAQQIITLANQQMEREKAQKAAIETAKE